MASKLSISDLADVLATLKEVAKPYQLGIQLKIDSSELDTIEKDHPKDIDRQKTEVIKYWLRNSPDASWTTLANAVERMGGHARLAERLISKENKSEEEKQTTLASRVKGHEEGSKEEKQTNEKPVLPSTPPDTPPPFRLRRRTNSWPMSFVDRNILLLGRMGHGKSTLGNRMLDRDGWFKSNDEQCPQTTQGSAVLSSATQLKYYRVKIYDHNGLFEGASSIDTFPAVLSELHLVVFVLKHGCRFDESKVKLIISKWQISEISALVLTHCERLSEEERGLKIAQFKKDHRSVAELMGKGILAVGFPDSSYVENETELSEKVEADKANLRQLIYSCDERVLIPESPQNANRQHSCCSIL